MTIFRSFIRVPVTLCSIALSSITFISCGSDSGPPPTGIASPALAILSSNYQLTSIALYNPQSGRLVDECVAPAALSKDVALPSGTQDGELVLIDRENAKIVFWDPASCMPRTQLSVSTGGFKSNPHDVVRISASKSYVTRYSTNAAPTADPSDFDEGDDVLIIDPSVPKVVNRIALTPFATSTTVQAAPDGAVLAEGRVYVTLNNLAEDFSTAGPGRVVIIDPTTDAVSGMIDLPNQTGCSGIEYVPSSMRLYVSCGGEFTDVDQTAASALVEIDISTQPPTIARTIPASALGRPIGYYSAAVLGGTAFIGTTGAFDLNGAMTAQDAFYAAPLDGGTSMKLFDGGAYNLGRPAVDGASMKVFLPDGDATTPRLQIFDVSSGSAVAGTPFEPNPAGHLPPREVARY